MGQDEEKMDYLQSAHPEVTNKDKVLNVQDHVAFHMDKIVGQFLGGSKITVIVRPPESVDGSRDFLMTDDDIDEAIKILERRKTRGNEYQAKTLGSKE